MPPEEEQENQIDENLDILIASYIEILYKAALKTQLSSSYEALIELNEARKLVGLNDVFIPAEKIKSEALGEVEKYKKLLGEKGGSYVVVIKEHEEVLEFLPWIDNMKEDTKEKLLTILSLPPEQLKTELLKLEDSAKKLRSASAAESETKIHEHFAKMRTWKHGGVKSVQRHLDPAYDNCGACIKMDGNIYLMDGYPAVPTHVHCHCYYTIYEFEEE